MLCFQSFLRFLFGCHLYLGVCLWLTVSCLFVSIELQLQEVNPAIRNGVYSHLEAFVPCNKDTLIKRLKKLHLNVQVMMARWAPAGVSYVTARRTECSRAVATQSQIKHNILDQLLDKFKSFFLYTWYCHYMRNKYFKYLRVFIWEWSAFILKAGYRLWRSVSAVITAYYCSHRVHIKAAVIMVMTG